MKNLKNIHKALFAFLIISCFVFSKCNKNKIDPQKEPEYYFTCKVNGQIYLPNNCANCITADLIGDTTLILGANRDFEALSIGIKDKGRITIREQELNHLDLQDKGGGGLYKKSTTTKDIYRTDQIRTGKLFIEYIDKTNKIISGTFYFKAFNAFRNDSVTVSEGKFRLKYHD